MGTVPRGREEVNRLGPRPSILRPLRRYSPRVAELGRTDTIDDLTSRQRARLRSLAHHLKPILHVGTDGVSDAVLASIEDAFNTREILKVKVLENAPLDVGQAADAITTALPDVRVPQTIGRTVVLYRPFPNHPEIRFDH